MPTATQAKRETREGRTPGGSARQHDEHDDGPAWSAHIAGERRFSLSLARGLAILRCYSSARPVLGIADLADELEMSRSTTHRYVITLVELGYLEQTSNRKYRLGLRVIDLGLSALSSTGLREHAHDYLKSLRQYTRLTTSLTVLDGTEIVVVDRVEDGYRTAGGNLQPGSKLPVYCTAAGKLLLTYLRSDQRRQLLNEIKLVPQGPNSITSKKVLLAELEGVAESRIAVNDEEWHAGETGIAVAVHNQAGEVVAAVSLTASSDRWPVQRLEDELYPHLASTADQISARLGFRR